MMRTRGGRGARIMPPNPAPSILGSMHGSSGEIITDRFYDEFTAENGHLVQSATLAIDSRRRHVADLNASSFTADIKDLERVARFELTKIVLPIPAGVTEHFAVLLVKYGNAELALGELFVGNVQNEPYTALIPLTPRDPVSNVVNYRFGSSGMRSVISVPKPIEKVAQQLRVTLKIFDPTTGLLVPYPFADSFVDPDENFILELDVDALIQ